MDPIRPITSRIPTLPAVERTGHREQQPREQKKREPNEREPQHEAEEHDGLPHIDVSV